jgi:PEP-CTERM motif
MNVSVGLQTLVIGVALAHSLSAVTIGQIDTFESGTTEGWVAGGGPNGQNPPVPPFVQSTGGPTGTDDAFLVITSGGVFGPGSRLTAFNIFGQWAGNYLTNGVGAIAMDLINLGQTELTIRLNFENPFAGGDFAVTNTAITLDVGSGWTHVLFPIGLGQHTAVGGTVSGALANTSVLRIMHAPGDDPDAIAGVLGVDNITAAVPEPGTIAMTLGGFGVLLLARRGRSRVRA